MSRGMRFMESSATEREDSYNYRIDWDDAVSVTYDYDNGVVKKHLGPGAKEVSGFDNAWDMYHYYKDKTEPLYIGVKLIQIDSYGNESIYAQ